jgi:hypothetical protein
MVNLMKLAKVLAGLAIASTTVLAGASSVKAETYTKLEYVGTLTTGTKVSIFMDSVKDLGNDDISYRYAPIRNP